MKAGIYSASELSNDDYHAVTDWYSSTQLKAVLPENYKKSESSEALAFGSLVHSVVLEPDTLDQYVTLDAERIGVKADGTAAQNPIMTAAWKRAVAEIERDGKTVVAQADWDRAHAMAKAIREHPTASRLLHSDDGASEGSVFVIDDDVLRHKARFDRHIPGLIIDLKTTSAKPGADSLTRTIIDYGYELSAAHYLAVAELHGLDVQGFCWVFVGKDEPYRVTVCEPDEDLLARGRALRAKAIRRLTDPTEAPYEGAHGFLTITCPAWARIEEYAL